MRYTEVHRRRWMELFEQGRSEDWIARHPIDDISESQRCDVRTVRTAIQNARKQDQILAAEGQLIQDSLKNHHDKLLQTVEGIIRLLGIPPSNESLPEQENSADWKNDELSYRRLLGEHLDNKTLVKLQKWEECYIRHFEARRVLKQSITALMREKTELEFSDGNQKPPYLYKESPHTVFCFILTSLLFSIGQKLNEKKSTIDLNHAIRFDSKTGRVMLKGVTIIENPGREGTYYQNILEVVSELLKSEADGEVRTSAKELGTASSNLTAPLRELILLEMVPGRCRICRRLGLH
jgi:hypothetical protein